MGRIFKKTWAIAVVAAAALVALLSACFAPPVASALVWGSADAESEWYFGEGQFELSALKQAAESWKSSLGGRTVSPVIIAVVDTGINAGHPVFDDVLVRDAAGNLMGYNSHVAVTVSDPTPQQLGAIGDVSADSHGTAVASEYAMMIRELGLQDYIKIYPIKASRTDNGAEKFSLASVRAAIDWAADHVGASVINLSLGIRKSVFQGVVNGDWENDPGLLASVNNAVSKSVLVAAAGNDPSGRGFDSDVDPFFPAAMDGVVSVMSLSSGGEKYRTSNYGSAYDVFAPGDGINVASGDSGYQRLNGTSMAAPFVGMTAALLRLRFDIEALDSGKEISPGAIARVLRTVESGDPTVTINGIVYKRLSAAEIINGDYSDITEVYSPVTGIKVTERNGAFDSERRLESKLSKLKPLELTAALAPVGDTDPDLDALIEWKLEHYSTSEDEDGNVTETLITETTLGKGKTLTYLPKQGGLFRIKAAITLGTRTISDTLYMELTYDDYLSGDVLIVPAIDGRPGNPSGTAVIYADDSLSLTLTGIEFVDKAPGIKWFVNGVYAASGEVFDFTGYGRGNYVITARYGDRPQVQNVFKITVRSSAARPLNAVSIALTAALAAAAGGATAIIWCRKRKAAA